MIFHKLKSSDYENTSWKTLCYSVDDKENEIKNYQRRIKTMQREKDEMHAEKESALTR